LKLGVFGGTFDPIHNGHIRIAELAYSRLRLDKLLFVPNSVPPHKPNVFATPSERFEMVKRAISGNVHFDIEDFEQRNTSFSYTYRTISYLYEKYNKPELYFICGADNINQIKNWKKPEIILKYARMAFITRPGYDFDTSYVFGDRAVFLEFPGIDVSSTKVRKRIKQGKNAEDMLPPKVNEFINENYLYVYDNLKTMLKTYINPKRYEHSLNVATEAVKLAKCYSVDTKKAYLAGLLHDCAKDIDFKKQIHLIQEYSSFKPLSDELHYPKVLHALTGAIVAERDFDIHDREVLSAIRYHTIGSVNMTPLDKIIYIADMIEPKRNYNGIEILREMAYNNINKAIIASIENTISYIGEENIQKDILVLKDYLKEREHERI